jgi:hypothetical protein
VVPGPLTAVLAAEALVAPLDEERLMTRLALSFGTVNAGDLHGEMDVDRGQQVLRHKPDLLVVLGP